MKIFRGTVYCLLYKIVIKHCITRATFNILPNPMSSNLFLWETKQKNSDKIMVLYFYKPEYY